MFLHTLHFKHLFFLIFLLPVLFVSCNKDDNNSDEVNEEELITTVKLTLTNRQTTEVAVYEGKDLDGVGGNPPLIDHIDIDAQTDYTLGVAFLDESNAQSVKDITLEVKQEDEDHLVCHSFTGNIAKIETIDKDGAGAPLGILSILTTGTPGNATLTIILKHKPDKNAVEPCSTGETDVELTFTLSVL